MVFRPLAGSVQHFYPGRHGSLVHGVDGGPVGRPERDVQFPGLIAGGRTQPEVGDAVGTGQAHEHVVPDREAHGLAHPDRGEGAQIEGERRLDVPGLQADVIEHARSLATGDDILAVTFSRAAPARRSWHTTRVAALKLPTLPFPLEPAGSPPTGCRVRHGTLILRAAAGTDMFVDPAAAGVSGVPDAGRFVGLPPAGDFTLAAQVQVEFGSM